MRGYSSYKEERNAPLGDQQVLSLRWTKNSTSRKDKSPESSKKFKRFNPPRGRGSLSMIPGILKVKDRLQEEKEDAVIRESMLWRNELWVVVNWSR